MNKLRFVLFLLFGVAFTWVGYHVYGYMLSDQAPSIAVSGIEQEGTYAGDVSCVLEASDDYRVSDISVWLDDAPLVTRHPVRDREIAYPFSIDTRTLSQGRHILSLQARDATYQRNATDTSYTIYVDNAPLHASFVTGEQEQKVFQGRTLHVQFQVNKPIKQATLSTLFQAYTCVPEVDRSHVYECFVPIPSDTQPNEYLLHITIEDYVGNTTSLDRTYQVVAYPFKKQRLNITAPQIAEEDSSVRSDAELENDIYWCTQASPQRKLWHGAFYIPCDIHGYSTEFGTMRTTQQYGKYRHDAVDILAPPRSVVWASQDGVVVIKDTFERSGNTVVIDHGCGVLTMYFHLDSFANIKPGQSIMRGKPIGYLGKSGYASGYHLHWELRINNMPVDPIEWTQTHL